MTFEEYLLNPMGKNNAVLSAMTRELVRKDYTYRFNNILLRENGKVDYVLYVDKENNRYYAHIKVPSEVITKFYYDVVVMFYTTSDKNTEGGKNLEKYDVAFYSNDPAFVFTYAHTFMTNNMFIKDLLPRMSKQAIKKEAVVKNPKNEVGYVKSIFFAYLFMKERGLLKQVSYGGAIDYNKNLLLATIMDADKKIALRQEEDKKIDHRKKLRIDAETYGKIKNLGIGNGATKRLQVEAPKKVKSVKSIGNTKSVKKVKETKSVKKT